MARVVLAAPGAPDSIASFRRSSLARAKSRLLAYIRLARPGDTSFALIGTVLGAGLAGLPATAWPFIALLALSNGCLSAASMMVNDWHDVAEDRINRPDRPIPSGAVSRLSALIAGVSFFVAGLIAAWLAAPPLGAAAAVVSLASVVYTWRLKRVTGIGNALTALLSSYPLWCWMLVTGSINQLQFGAAIGFFFGSVGREVIRTAADHGGDQANSIRTIATRWGARTANRIGLAAILTGVTVAAIATYPTHSFGYQTGLALTLLCFALAIVRWRRSPPAVVSRRLTWLARAMTFALALGVAWDLMSRGGLLK